MSVEQLIRDFNERGLENVLGTPSTSVLRREPVSEPVPAPVQPMRTRTTQKKDKGELRSKKNQDRESKRPEDPPAAMDPEAESSSEEPEMQPQRPPYLAPIPQGVEPPKQPAKFSLLTPLLPKVVPMEGTPTGKVAALRYSDHDTNDREKFPQFAPGKFLRTVTYNKVSMVEIKQWAVGLEQFGLLRMLNIPHFGHNAHVNAVVKQLLVLVHNEHLFIGHE